MQSLKVGDKVKLIGEKLQQTFTVIDVSPRYILDGVGGTWSHDEVRKVEGTHNAEA